MLLDKIYIDIKKTILKKSFLFNIISNKNNNIKSEQILNITILIKNYHTFYLFSEFVKDKYLNIIKKTF